MNVNRAINSALCGILKNIRKKKINYCVKPRKLCSASKLSTIVEKEKDETEDIFHTKPKKIRNIKIKRLPQDNIVTFRELKEKVLDEFTNADALAGTKWTRFPSLTKLLKGHRKGELTIVTGTTGCGKTTFLSEYSLDLCMQGVKTLWGNFEMTNVRLLKLMLNQFAEKSLLHNLHEFEDWATKFQDLQLYFLTFHGEQPFNIVLDTMTYAVQEFGVEHIIIDNLQFMVGQKPGKFDKFDYQDKVIGSCRNFATTHNCHITLVIHPRKENLEELTTNSIFGGGKATQEADNVIILQVKWNGNGNYQFKKYLQVTKNRYDGTLGIVPLRFNKSTLGFGGQKKLNNSKIHDGSDSSGSDEDKS